MTHSSTGKIILLFYVYHSQNSEVSNPESFASLPIIVCHTCLMLVSLAWLARIVELVLLLPLSGKHTNGRSEMQKPPMAIKRLDPLYGSTVVSWLVTWKRMISVKLHGAIVQLKMGMSVERLTHTQWQSRPRPSPVGVLCAYVESEGFMELVQYLKPEFLMPLRATATKHTEAKSQASQGRWASFDHRLLDSSHYLFLHLCWLGAGLSGRNTFIGRVMMVSDCPDYTGGCSTGASCSTLSQYWTNSKNCCLH